MDLTGHLGERCLSPVANTAARVHVVDDDPYVRSSLGRLLSVKGYQVSVHDSADAYLRDPDAFEWGCLVLDVAMPGLNGLELQDALRERQAQKPIIFLTGRGDVPMCARAMKRGAVEFLTKPVDAALLIEAVERALDRDTAMREESALRADAQARLATLTVRERQVLEEVVRGRLNKQIASDIGAAEKTVKVHRGRMMGKMRVRSVAELVHIVDRART